LFCLHTSCLRLQISMNIFPQLFRLVRQKKRKSWIAKLISFLFNDLHLSCSQSKKINIPVEWFDNHHCVYQILFLKWMKQVFLFTYALMNQNWLIIFSKDF
jgi:hypothetical protein